MGLRFRVPAPQQPAAGSRIARPAGPGARSGRKRRFCFLKKKLSELSLSSGRKSFFIFFVPFLTLPHLSRKKKKNSAGEELIGIKKRKREIENFLSPERRAAGEIFGRPPAFSASSFLGGTPAPAGVLGDAGPCDLRCSLSAPFLKSRGDGREGGSEGNAPPSRLKASAAAALRPPEPPAAPLRN